MLTIFLLLAQAAAAAPNAPDDFANMSVAQLKQGIENRHPAAYYVLAGKLLAAGPKDEAVFWFYAGQLRYRFHLGANPNLAPSGDPALFASLGEVVGRPLNEYAFGDLKTLRATIDKVLKWDKDTANGFTSKEKNAKAWEETRAGLLKMAAYIDQKADSIRKQRTANGLANR
jgi:hypothetical protein